jgi:tetratricopeptide (TPR) repeat protein
MMPRRSYALLSGFAILLAAASAGAAGGQRYTTIFEAWRDDAQQPIFAGEAVLIQRLVDAGVVFVDEGQSRQVRSVTDAGTLLEGSVSPVLTSLDVDVIVAGVCRTGRFESELLGDHAKRYDTSLVARVIAVDTGQVLAALEVRGQGLGFTAEQAATEAEKKAAAELADRILALGDGAARLGRVELTVGGIPNVTEGESVVSAVRALPAVRDLRVLQSGRGATKLAIETDGATSRELALAIDGAAGLGLSVFGYTAGAIRADWTPAAALSLAVAVAPFDVRGSLRPADRWQEGALPGAVATSLSNLPFVTLPFGPEPQRAAGSAAGLGRKLSERSLVPERTLVLEGALRPAGDRIVVEARLRAVASDIVVLSGTRECAGDASVPCAAALGATLADGLLPALEARRASLRGLPATPPAAPPPQRKPLVVRSLDPAALFPARLAAYADGGAGRARVANTGDAPIEDLVVSVDVPGFTRAPVDVRVGRLPAGEERDVSLSLVLDPAVLSRHEESSPAALRVRFTYGYEDLAVEQEQSSGTVVHGRSALSWAEPESVAAFVTPEAAAVRSLGAAAVAARGADAASDPMALATALVAVYANEGLRYVADPAASFGGESIDHVLPAGETLARRAGDCDDLSVLLASLAESVGIATLFVVTPDHVLVAFDSGLPPQAADRLSLDRGRTLEHEGRLWVPLESTITDASLAAQWDAAAAELRRWQDAPGRLRLVPVRTAWRRFPPSGLSIAAGAADLPRPADVAGRVERERQALSARRKDELAAAIRAAEAAIAADGQTPARVARLARLVALDGRTDDAIGVLQGVPGARRDVAVSNNLGNLQVIRGDIAAARAAYDAALSIAPDDVPVHLNAAIAAWLAEDDEAFGAHVFACLDHGAVDEVEQLSRAGVQAAEGTTGADAGTRARGDLARALRRILAERGGASAAPETDAGPRASDAGGGGANAVEELLYWK